MNHIKHIRKDVDIKETSKTAEITDPFGNLRYRVVLTSFDVTDDDCYNRCYQIQVISYYGTSEEIIVAEQPIEDEDRIYDYEYALKVYDDYIKSYSMLIRAEHRDHQDIETYQDSIGYEKTIPECCATCKWCKKRPGPEHPHNVQYIEKLQCTCPENCREFEEDIVRAHEPHRNRVEDMLGHKVFHKDFDCDIIYPGVDPFGKCKNYEKNCEKFHVPHKHMIYDKEEKQHKISGLDCGGADR